MVDEILENLKGKVPYIIAGIAAGYFLKNLIDDLERANLLWDIEQDYGIADDEIIEAKSE
ncbi:MAG: hypothetical protein HZA00_10155 [Nitrospinae bacterium]|nr:hypothetical protein [Nitrospinota bacterium]